MFFWNAAQRPQGGLQPGGQCHEALTGVDDRDVALARVNQGKLVQAVRKDGSVNFYLEVISHCEVRQALASGWMFLGKVDLALDSKLGPPQAPASLQGAAARWCPTGRGSGAGVLRAG